ncbi:secreted RxLR effector protein 161-like [Coffea arabica]|uniref:Secreted RxLR effector protein 161-like n=1 Tax=Coffea arabica TaxID=13443 RepID=A0ABM4WMT7_COFAR
MKYSMDKLAQLYMDEIVKLHGVPVSIVSDRDLRYQANLRDGHRMAVKNIVKYLRRTKDIILVYEEDNLLVEGYNDANYQSNKNDSKSQFRDVFTLNSGVVTWKSFKQETITGSTTETKYIIAVEAAKEAV